MVPVQKPKSWAEFVQAARGDWSQARLGERLNVEQQTVCRYEQGKKPRGRMADLIVRKLLRRYRVVTGQDMTRDEVLRLLEAA